MQSAIGIRKPDFDPFGAGMAESVSNCFSANAVHFVPNQRMQRAPITLNQNLKVGQFSSAEFRSHTSQGLDQIVGRSRGRAKVPQPAPPTVD
jgi:hypothetical protein